MTARQWLLRQGYRVAWVGLFLWTRIARPNSQGVKCVLTHQGDVLLVRHTYGCPRPWELPGGGLRRGESPSEAARREMREELGLRSLELRELVTTDLRIHGRRLTIHAFQAELSSRELRIDPVEIARARWFPREELVARIPSYWRTIAELVR